MAPMAPENDPTRTWMAPAVPARAVLRVKASRFLADVAQATSAAHADAHLKRLHAEFPQATHHCWAFRAQDRAGCVIEQCSDAGEPSGSAGQPILRAMLAAGIEEATLVVVRWFGGTKLGVGPLGRAYRDAAAAALLAAGTQRRQHLMRLEICFPFDISAAVRRALHRAGGTICEERASAHATLVVRVPAAAAAALQDAVVDASRGKAEVLALERTTGGAQTTGRRAR